MKKFYIPIFAAVFLFSSFISLGQTYTSISSNPGNLTFDDPNFWVGNVPPPNPCNGCNINILTNVSMVQTGSSSAPGVTIFTGQTPAAGPILNPLPSPPGPAITLGTKFQSSVNGYITGVRFYKGVGMGNSHQGLLWQLTPTVVLLGTVNFSGETPSGWQTASFASPIAIIATSNYMVGYYVPDGLFEVDNNYFTSALTNGNLTALQDNPVLTGPNGIFNNGSPATLPSTAPFGGYNAINSWVDVNFSSVVNLSDMVFTNSVIKVIGNTTLSIKTFVQLFNSTLVVGNDPTSVAVIKLNDQIELNNPSTVQIGNDFSYINANYDFLNPIAGTYQQVGNPGTIEPGIYAVSATDPLGYTATLQAGGLGSATNQYQPVNGVTTYNYYILNCLPVVPASPNTCGDGVVSGPALTSLQSTPSWGILFGQSVTLPVVLVQFLATKNDDGTVKVSWATSQEQNSSYFDVERSGDQANWTTIGTVKAKGYASTTTNYYLTDKQPLDGTGYYRLKMVDLDGKFKYSITVAVTSDKDSRPLVIYSNPFSDMIRLKVNVSRAQNLNIIVSDIIGKIYINQSYQAQAGDNFVNLQPSSVSSGMYILHIQGDSYDQTVKLEKQ